MACKVIEGNEVITCPHCGEIVVLRVSTNVYETGKLGEPIISVDEEMSNRKPIKFDYRGRVKK